MRLTRLFPQGNSWWLIAGLWLVSTAQAAVTLDGTLGRAGALPGLNSDFLLPCSFGVALFPVSYTSE